ncbi:MAG: hypothetical protein NW223_03635 [Hyphomicrobiaceae bacterium]|nr:hypothetical protein [Hyphomicrobiaceae bacterium]
MRYRHAELRLRSAEIRARELLRSCLTPSQWDDYVHHDCFLVRGGTTGRPYRIHRGAVMNVEPLNEDGSSTGQRLCFAPVGGLPMGDVLVGQKFALEGMEEQVLTIANPQWGHVRLAARDTAQSYRGVGMRPRG